MNEPLIIAGELITTEDGSTIVGRDDLNGLIYEWCHGRCDNVRITVEDISEEGDL